MQASEIIWHPICVPNEAIKIIVWDVVDKAIDPTPQVQRTKQLPDASTVDTYSRADGIIVVYDPRDDESIKYAQSILDQSPPETPLLLVMNFADTLDASHLIPPQMIEYANRFFHLTASMKTNKGLAELANWLDLPLNVSLSKLYEIHLKESEENLKTLMEEFNQAGFNEEAAPQKPSLNDNENNKDFWENETDNNKMPNLGLGPPEVPADFFMDDDEEDLKTQKNLEKLMKEQNIASIEEEEEDEDIKRMKAAKKAKILKKSKGPNQNQQKLQSQKLKKQRNQSDEDEDYNEEELNENQNDQQTKPLPQIPSPPKIDFDIPIVTNNENAFFSDGDDGFGDDENDDMKLKIDDEEEEEKPKIKKSKILPKSKPPQIIIKPAPTQPKKEESAIKEKTKESIQEPTKEPVEEAVSEPTKESVEIPMNEPTNELLTDSKNLVKVGEPKLEIPSFTVEKDSFFSDNDDDKDDDFSAIKPDFPEEEEKPKKTIILPKTTKPSVPTQKDPISKQTSIPEEENNSNEISFPTFDDDEKENNQTLPTFDENNDNIDFPTFGDENETNNENDNEIPNNEHNENKNKGDTNEFTLSSFGNNDDFFGENENTQKEDENAESVTEKTDMQIFESNKNEEKTNENELPSNVSDLIKAEVTLPSFDNEGFFSDNENEESDWQAEAQKMLDNTKENDHEEEKPKKKALILPKTSNPTINKNIPELTTKPEIPLKDEQQEIKNEFDFGKKEEDKKENNEFSFPAFESNDFFNDNKNETNNQSTDNFGNITFPEISFPTTAEPAANSEKPITEQSITKKSEIGGIAAQNITIPTFNTDGFFSDGDEDENLQIPTSQNQSLEQTKDEEDEKVSISKKSAIIPKKANAINNETINIKQEENVQKSEFNFDSFGNNSFFNSPSEPKKDDNSSFGGFFDSVSPIESIPDTNTKEPAALELESKATAQIPPNESKLENESKLDNENLNEPFEEQQKSQEISLSDINIPTMNLSSNDSFFKSNKPAPKTVADLPPPPPIDFSHGFLSEKPIAAENSNNIINSPVAVADDFDITAFMKKTTAAYSSMEQQQPNQQIDQFSSQQLNQPNQQIPASSAAPSGYESFGDYENFDDAPKEKRHHKSRSGGSHRHRSSRRSKKNEAPNATQEETRQEQNDDSNYLSFD
ncbi:hypothetical protein TRFO_01892 [Tritrichomonas foetus]|uniref:Uncharacterized protein n=1 Tax=Tritrichomonas foetus TaxID=1144522 RepID=A0A1J4JI60_9EUKA|nr:hypothetical protein TRFO_01892 [Tritrichomonas foetus]|eukprot:OHS98822.1 hypothetical protein TRFO_01892 [Tritrichomonas foetus]